MPTSGGPPTGLDVLASQLRAMRAQAGQPSYAQIALDVTHLRESRGAQVWEARPGRVTVYEVFQDGRRRLDIALVQDIATVLGHPEERDNLLATYREASYSRASGTARPRVEPLPTDLPRLVGREDELHRAILRITALADSTSDTVLVAVSGIAGSGKTAFARELCRRLGAEPDLSPAIEASLRTASGDSPTQRVSTALVLAAVESEMRRASEDEAGHRERPVVLVDDVPTGQEARILADGVPTGALVVATSRRSLSDGEPDLALDLPGLDTDACVTVLREGIGGDRMTEPDADQILHILATRCAGLPLAVTLLSSRIRSHPSWSLRDTLTWLDQRTSPLVPFLEDAYDALDADSQTALRFLAIHSGRLDAEELGAMLGVDVTSARSALVHLGAEHLVTQRAEDGRVDMHDLVREFAQGRSAVVDPYSRTRTSLERLGAHLLTGHQNASTAWQEDHVEVVVTTAQLAADHQLPELVTALSCDWEVFLRRTIRDSDSLLLHYAAVTGGTPEGRNDAIRRYAHTLLYLGRLQESFDLLTPVLHEFDDPRRYHTEALIADAYRFEGRYREAETHYRAAFDAALDAGDAWVTLICHNGLTEIWLDDHHLREVEDITERVLALVPAGDAHHQASLLNIQANALLRRGDWTAGERILSRSTELAVSVDRSDLVLQNRILAADAALRRGDLARAQDLLTGIIDEAARVGEFFLQFWARRSMADLSLEVGDLDAVELLLAQAEEFVEAGGWADLHEVRTQVHLRRGDLARAQASLARAQATALEDANARDSLRLIEGDAAYAAGDLEAAEAVWQSLLDDQVPEWWALPARERLARLRAEAGRPLPSTP